MIGYDSALFLAVLVIAVIVSALILAFAWFVTAFVQMWRDLSAREREITRRHHRQMWGGDDR